MNKIKNIILHLSLINGIGPKLISYLSKDYTDDLTNLYSLKEEDFISLYSFSPQKAKLIYHGLKNTKHIEDELLEIEKQHASFITPYEIDYPFYLKQNNTFPSILYYKNKNKSLPINNFIPLSIVSSRKTNSYGQRVIKNLIKDISGNNLILFSGGAIGGDTYIHESALKNNIPTAVILGSGLSFLYPKSNERLFSEIYQNDGIIMSHFSMKTTASQSTFPIRNSIIAGISKGVLVIQAGEKSGTLITANYALEYGREVGAIPGYIDDEVMIESNNLIKQGAHCITKGNDILNMLNISSKENKKKVNSDSDTTDKYFDCNEIQKNILKTCLQPQNIENISELLIIPISDLYKELFFLAEKQYIKDDILGFWVTI